MGIENFKDTKIYQVSQKRADVFMHDQDAAWNANKKFQELDNQAHLHKVWHNGVWWENGVPNPRQPQKK